MYLDLRIPMGLMFTFTGAIMTTWGIKTNGDTTLYAKSLGLNVNLWWGMVLLVFGLVMLVLGRRGQTRALREEKQEGPQEEGSERRGH